MEEKIRSLEEKIRVLESTPQPLPTAASASASLEPVISEAARQEQIRLFEEKENLRKECESLKVALEKAAKDARAAEKTRTRFTEALHSHFSFLPLSYSYFHISSLNIVQNCIKNHLQLDDVPN